MRSVASRPRTTEEGLVRLIPTQFGMWTWADDDVWGAVTRVWFSECHRLTKEKEMRTERVVM